MKILGIVVEYNPFHTGHLYHLEKAKEIDDNNKLIYYNIASIYGDLGDKKLALENIDKALSIDNDDNDAIKLKEYINNLD